jgi:superfamily II DNA or RNA helicase
VNHDNKKKKKNKKLMDEFRAQEGSAAIFLSPTKIQDFRDLNERREQAKVDEQASKQLAKNERESKKIAKQEEAKRKKQERAKQQVAKKAAEAAAKASKEQAKEAANASKQLDIDLQSSTKKQRRQNPLLSIPQLPPPPHNIEVVVGPSNPASQRPSRAKRTPAYLEGFQL